MTSILVLGSDGQLGQELQVLSQSISAPFQFQFVNRRKLDLSNIGLEKKLLEYNFDIIINAAAYTQVDAAEDNVDLCYKINTDAVKSLALFCKVHDKILLHVSTDYVYNNYSKVPLKENSPQLPQGVYARSKYYGELSISSILPSHYIIRTSWLYSIFGSNFIKTMLKLSEKYSNLKIVNDQLGTPTNAKNLAQVILQILKEKIPFGTYNFSDNGKCTWYQFANYIFKTKNISIETHTISTSDYGAKAPRPLYSILDNTKLETVLKNISRSDWKENVSEVLRKL